MNIFNKFAFVSGVVLFSATSFACDKPSPEGDRTAKKSFIISNGKKIRAEGNPSKRKLFQNDIEEDVSKVFNPQTDKRRVVDNPQPEINIVPHFRTIDEFMAEAERMRQDLTEFNQQLECQIYDNKSVAAKHFPNTSKKGENAHQLVEAASKGFLSKEKYSQEDISRELRILQTSDAAEYCKKAKLDQVKVFKAAYNANKSVHVTDSLLRLNHEFVFYRTLIAKLFDLLSGYQRKGVLGVYFKGFDDQKTMFEANSAKLANVFEACWNIERDVCVHWPLLKLTPHELAASWRSMWGALHEKKGLRDTMKGLFKNYVSSVYTYLYASGVTCGDLDNFYSLLCVGRVIDYRDKESLITMASVENLDAFLLLRSLELDSKISVSDLANNRALLTQIGSFIRKNREAIKVLSFPGGMSVSEGEEAFKRAEQIFIQIQGYHKRLTEGTVTLSEEQETKLKQLYRDGHKIDALAELLLTSCMKMNSETTLPVNDITQPCPSL